MNTELHQPQAPINPEAATAGVYGSMNAQTGVIGEVHIGDVEANISQHVAAEYTGAAALDAANYIDPSRRGVLAAQYGSEASFAQMAAVQAEATRAAVDSIFENSSDDADDNEKELVGADRR